MPDHPGLSRHLARSRRACRCEVDDPRDPRGKQWKLETLLDAMLVGMIAEAEGLSEVYDALIAATERETEGLAATA